MWIGPIGHGGDEADDSGIEPSLKKSYLAFNNEVHNNVNTVFEGGARAPDLSTCTVEATLIRDRGTAGGTADLKST